MLDVHNSLIWYRKLQTSPLTTNDIASILGDIVSLNLVEDIDIVAASLRWNGRNAQMRSAQSRLAFHGEIVVQQYLGIFRRPRYVVATDHVAFGHLGVEVVGVT